MFFIKIKEEKYGIFNFSRRRSIVKKNDYFGGVNILDDFKFIYIF